MDKATILIVDDEVEILKSLSAILEDEYIVLTTSSGKDVPSILEANAVSLLVLDLMMPEMTGLELIESIRSRNNSGDNEMPILVVTGDYWREQDKQLAALNVQGCVKKPVDLKMLRDKIQMILKKATYAFLTLSLLILLAASSAFAERIGIGAGIGFMNFEEPAMRITGPQLLPSVNLNFGVDAHTSIELSVGRTTIKTVVKDPLLPSGGTTVEITSIPVFLTVQPRLHLGNFSPYIGGGIGYYINSNTETPSEIKDFVTTQRLTTDPNYNITQDAGNVYGAHAAIGGDYFISKNVAYGIDIKQSWSWGIVTTKHSGSSGTTTFKEKLDFNATIITAGVKYLF